jgi:hypothetical protein
MNALERASYAHRGKFLCHSGDALLSMPALQNPINYRLTSSQCQITYDGNRRLARLLALLMALQTGLPPLDCGPMTGRGKRVYIAGIHSAMNRDYSSLTAMMVRVIARSKRRAASSGR